MYGKEKTCGTTILLESYIQHTLDQILSHLSENERSEQVSENFRIDKIFVVKNFSSVIIFVGINYSPVNIFSSDKKFVTFYRQSLYRYGIH